MLHTPKKHPLQSQLESEQAPDVEDCLPTIQRFYVRWKALKAEQSAIEDALGLLKKEINSLEFDTLPNLLMEAGLDHVRLADGATLTVKPTVHPSITKANQAAAYQWLRDNDLGDIIKSVLLLTFNTGDDAGKAKVHAFLEEVGLPCSIADKESIHASTLKASIREALDQGVVFPDNLFSIHTATPVKITPGK